MSAEVIYGISIVAVVFALTVSIVNAFRQNVALKRQNDAFRDMGNVFKEAELASKQLRAVASGDVLPVPSDASFRGRHFAISFGTDDLQVLGPDWWVSGSSNRSSWYWTMPISPGSYSDHFGTDLGATLEHAAKVGQIGHKELNQLMVWLSETPATMLSKNRSPLLEWDRTIGVYELVNQRRSAGLYSPVGGGRGVTVFHGDSGLVSH